MKQVESNYFLNLNIISNLFQNGSIKVFESITLLYKLGWLPDKNGYEYDGENKPEARKLSLTFWNTYVEVIQIMKSFSRE
ncbi:hypothetical protein C8C85_2293 [Flavobacterium sp. 103]|uniref:hypothetical protein n=1 Tax=Flavobacterium sp. 103 TaxID=2135624 RepID=UPI000D5F6650|nr:hypothetical protein [Flavobacterium sp. 103]PVX46436.1 hypothetical protein C8C85_2293 [Flavobacterium sp. 103]